MQVFAYKMCNFLKKVFQCPPNRAIFLLFEAEPWFEPIGLCSSSRAALFEGLAAKPLVRNSSQTGALPQTGF